MTLKADIEDIRSGMRMGRFINEASVSQGVVLRLLHSLGWPTYDTRVICPEYSLKGLRVDFALCHPQEKPIAFVEVKQVGQGIGAEQQLFEYAFHVGVPLAILTDGREWNFFLPAEQGNYVERRVYKLDLVDRDIEDCISRLERYLQYDAVISGKAIENARNDYKDVARKRQIATALPEAWHKLLNECDEMLMEILSDQVESLCGFKPDSDTVADFLRQQPKGVTQSETKTTYIPRSRPSVSPIVSNGNVQSSPQTKHPIGFSLHGTFYPAKNSTGVLTQFFEEISKTDATICERFASLPKHGRNRRYLAKNKYEIYQQSPHLAELSIQLSSGWWLPTNNSKQQIVSIIQAACEVARLQYGKDVLVYLGGE